MRDPGTHVLWLDECDADAAPLVARVEGPAAPGRAGPATG